MCRKTMGRSPSAMVLATFALLMSACDGEFLAPEAGAPELTPARAGAASTTSELRYVVSWLEDGEPVMHVVTPVETASDVTTFYTAGVGGPPAARTGHEVADEATVMLHRDTNTGLVSLVVIFDDLTGASDPIREARSHLDLESGETVTFPVLDDSGEKFSFSAGTYTAFHRWAGANTDGWAARGGFEGLFERSLRLRDMTGLTGIGWVDGDGQRIQVPVGASETRIWLIGTDEPLEATDETAPEIEATITGTEGENGWFVGDVSIEWTVTDGESDITGTTGCDAAQVTEDTDGIMFTCEATSGGGTASESVTIMRDATPPALSFSGDEAYDVDGHVAIDCAASDAMSGLASSDCTSIDAAAWTFGAGTTTLGASAADNAGNEATASFAFVVAPTTGGICGLIGEWVSSKGVSNALCKKLENAEKSAAKGNAKARAGQLGAFVAQVEDIRGEWLSDEQADALIAFVGAL